MLSPLFIPVDSPLAAVAEIALVVVATYYVFLFIGFSMHLFVHTKYSGFLNRIHLQHHIITYPPHRLQSETYKTESGGLLYKLPFVVFFVTMFYKLFPFRFAVVIVIELLLICMIAEFLHESYHLSHPPKWLERSSTWRRWRHQHYVHHRDYFKNLTLGCGDLTPDKLFGTYKI